MAITWTISVNAVALMYKPNVIHILYQRIWFTSGLCSLFSQWLAGSMVIMLSSHVAVFSVTFHFQLNYSFFVGWLRFSISVCVTFRVIFYTL